MKKNLIVIICAAVSAVISFIVMDFTEIGLIGINKLNNGYGIFDAKLFGYKTEEFYRVLNLLGAEGIKKHFVVHLIDYIFMISYATLMTAVGSLFLKEKKKKFAAVLPLLLLASDVLENALIDLCMLKYPMENGIMVQAASAFTVTKWVLTALWGIGFVVMAVVYVINRRNKKKEA